ncbi:hypothetical protein [Bacillus sp. FJAT-22090]|uniref:hypothetical protein n=1 Tax=Bacillus sp. FJAT-22090 TaxID=1581038 RepID=UPI0011A371DC|nr:hypothetical protein [Bacillus sp. FJAT-22090]
MTNVITWSPLLFANPINKNYNTREELEEISKQIEKSQDVGFIESTQNFMTFIYDIKARGLSYALYDKPFSQVLADTFTEIARALGIFILGNGDLFFLMPALAAMLGTFIIGRNKFTKFIIPLWFTYFLSRVFFRMLL